MKLKNITLFALGFFILILLNSNSSGPAANGNGDRTGSPLAGGTCATCHSGGSFGATFSIVAKDAQNNTVTSYFPDSVYTLEFAVNTTTAPNGFGMQATILNAANSVSIGALANASSNAKVTTINGTQDIVEHNALSATNSFSIQWTAPSMGNGNVNIYGAGAAMNGNGGTSGDQGSLGVSLVLSEATPPCIPTAETISPIACGSYIVPSGDSTYTSSAMIMDTVMNAGGCDSVITINLTVNSPSSATINPAVCGDYTAPSGAIYTMSGMYMDTIPNMATCDSVITINLTVTNNSAATISPSVCDSFIAPSGMVYYSSGMYMDTILNMATCDSVITINLIVGAKHATINANTCTGSYTVPSGAIYTMSGIYMDTIASAISGCDSILTINLTLDTATYSTINPTMCAMYTVPSGDSTYTSSGMYMDTIANMAGCDSIITINLTITGAVTSTINPQSCTGSYTVPSGNATYTMSGVYMDTIPSTGNCDSIITINLTVGLPTVDTITVLSCTGSYTVPSGDSTYTVSGTYMDTITNVSGCDSVITINLTVANPAFAYGATQYCSSTSANVTPTITGTTGGVFSSTSGLLLNGGTGEITMTGSNAGTYMVNYAVSGCQDSVSVELGQTLSISVAYNGSQCTGTNGAAPTLTGYTGAGTFVISPTGLGINANTGALNLGGSATGTYTVDYTANDICSSTASTSVTVTNTAAAAFSYDSIAYCQESTTNPVPSVSGGTSGSFLCLSGAVVNSSTGAIDLNASTPNYHPIHYLTTGTCPDTVTIVVRIKDCLPPVSVNEIEAEANYRLMPNPNNGNFAILNDKVAHMATIEVFDLVGKMVHAEQVLLAEDAVHHIRPAQQLSEGYYFVRIVDEKTQRTFKMQVLNR